MYKNVMLAGALVVIGAMQAMEACKPGAAYQGVESRLLQVQPSSLSLGELVVILTKGDPQWAQVVGIESSSIAFNLGGYLKILTLYGPTRSLKSTYNVYRVISMPRASEDMPPAKRVCR